MIRPNTTADAVSVLMLREALEGVPDEKLLPLLEDIILVKAHALDHNRLQTMGNRLCRTADALERSKR